jgi:hypothetical protein
MGTEVKEVEDAKNAGKRPRGNDKAQSKDLKQQNDL